MVTRIAASSYPTTSRSKRDWWAQLRRAFAIQSWPAANGDYPEPALRHDFAITNLGQPPGWFRANRYRFLCIRCGWIFRVENRRGDAIAVGANDVPLAELENQRRVATFQFGPC